MRKGIYILPNAITLCGMFSGYYSIVMLFNGRYVVAGWAIMLAGVFDAMDGWVARMTNSTSKFGIELDSLSDVIAFGVAPSLLVYKWALWPFGRVGWAVAFLYTACGAMRLARFNIQMGSTEKKSFTGMPIPAAAGIIATSVVFFAHMGLTSERSHYALIVTTIISLLMVSTLRFHSLKELNLRDRKPFVILVLFVLTLSIIIMHPEISLFVVGITYLSIGLVENAYIMLFKREKP